MNYLIHHYLDHWAKISPKSDVVVCLEKGLTYDELMSRSNQLANFFMDKGVKIGERIGIYLDKSIDLPVAIYGVLKAGGAYVPLDPSAPASRINEIIIDCSIRFIVSADRQLKTLAQLANDETTKLTVVGLSTKAPLTLECVDWATIFTQYNKALVSPKIIESDLAYILYTSGSTGKPKGIMHTHHSALSFARWAASEFTVSSSDRLGNQAPLHFDLSIFDWFSAIICGACTIVIPEQYTKFPASFSQLIADSKISVLYSVPYALSQMALRGALEERDLRHLRLIMYAGEPFVIKHLRLLRKLLPHVQFDNVYGPTEVNACTHYTVEALPDDASSVPIGKVNQISKALIIDSNGKEVLPGEQGELLIRSPTMMQGYWGRDDLNAAAIYVHHPIDTKQASYQQYFYRTGDLVVQAADDNLWFVGRKDRQIKVRGYRVELDEIEAILVAYAQIEEAAVFAIETNDEVKKIYASYTLKPGVNVEHTDINRYLKAVLPVYSLPSLLPPRDDFPRTASGKIDRNALSQEILYDEA